MTERCILDVDHVAAGGLLVCVDRLVGRERNLHVLSAMDRHVGHVLEHRRHRRRILPIVRSRKRQTGGEDAAFRTGIGIVFHQHVFRAHAAQRVAGHVGLRGIGAVLRLHLGKHCQRIRLASRVGRGDAAKVDCLARRIGQLIEQRHDHDGGMGGSESRGVEITVDLIGEINGIGAHVQLVEIERCGIGDQGIIAVGQQYPVVHAVEGSVQPLTRLRVGVRRGRVQTDRAGNICDTQHNCS